VLTSAKNPKVAAAMRLKKRAYREEDGRFLVEGAQGVREALEPPVALETLFTATDDEPLAIRARQLGVEVHHVSPEVLARITSTVTPQPLVGIAPHRDVELAALDGSGMLVVLHEVRDPGNAGTILRSADASGAGGVVFTATSVDPYNPKTVRASAGSIFHVPVIRRVGTIAAIEHLRGRGVRVLAVDPAGSQDLYRSDLSDPVAFVFGNEAHGLPADVVRASDASVRVPHRGGAESLNLAAAATVCLFEHARRATDGIEASLQAMIGAAAHDLRSPLTALKGFGYALEKRWDEMDPDQRGAMLRGIVADADRMDTLVRRLTDAARLANGTLELFPERVELADLAVSVTRAFEHDPEHPGVRWIGEGGTALLDPTRLRTTLLAFVEAATWWGREGAVSIGAVWADGTVRIDVRRDGAELDARAAEELFDVRRTDAGGGAFGLSVAGGVAASQGGRAWATVDDGALVLHLELPVRPGP
jgi:RNA methyltransferase, TrmH family